jgi:hypothetical protein
MIMWIDPAHARTKKRHIFVMLVFVFLLVQGMPTALIGVLATMNVFNR